MKKILFALAAICAVIFVSCQQEALHPTETETTEIETSAIENSSVFPETIYAGTAEDQDTKAGMDKVGTVYKHHWQS